MALDPQFAKTITRVEAYFGFDSFACDPDAISDRLAVQPDKVRRRGQVMSQHGARTIRAHFNTWELHSKSESKDVNDHLRELLGRLDGRASLLDAEWGVPGFSLLYKATHLASGNGPFFESDVLRGIASFGAELWQDIYAHDDLPGQDDSETG